MVRKLPEEEYERNFQFKAHVINLMSSLDQAVKTLDQPEIVIEMMLKIGDSHRKRKLQEQHFYVSFFLFITKLSPAHPSAWNLKKKI